MSNSEKSMEIAIAWCLAWGEGREPQFGLSKVASIKEAIKKKEGIPSALQPFVQQVEKLDNLEFPKTTTELCKIFEKLQQEKPEAWNTSIGLVYGGWCG